MRTKSQIRWLQKVRTQLSGLDLQGGSFQRREPEITEAVALQRAAEGWQTALQSPNLPPCQAAVKWTLVGSGLFRLSTVVNDNMHRPQHPMLPTSASCNLPEGAARGGIMCPARCARDTQRPGLVSRAAEGRDVDNLRGKVVLDDFPFSGFPSD
ncbi:unnamed protein product [Pleuronectes platessa]|uniref:Uncharacterized protein n=1 Tax=Pleuronectes platessa TaxID=8262 RepID=A0A9N7UM71_PLEPL|nr:unnamed protein product [Pleuronectes platessa]